ncbi:hypothetical protein MVEG_08329 [Podila verticillata NRRL 6337]|nr:hypothetical protein MVEG_08329 [Podila verticillata NRRL 6337]
MTTVSEQQSTVQEQETKKQKEEKKVFQQFRGKDKAILEPEPPVRAHPEGDEYYVYWADIQDAFSNIDHLEKFLSKDDDTTTHGLRVLFKTEPYNGFERLSTPLRVKYSMNPHTVITRDDLYDASSDVVALGTHQNRVELDRYMQEQEQFLSWVRETKTADPEVLYQTYLSQDAYRKDTDRRYASVLNPNPFIRLIRMFQGDRDIKQFYVERIYGLSEPLWCLDFADPRLFLVLPSDLGAWDDNDVTTHNFRLYFLCDFKYRKECDHKSRSLRLGSEIQPRHIHLSGHRGYDLKRSDEFFDKFGHFALEILKVVKDGFLDEYCSVPSLNTFRILECCEDTIIQHHLTRDNIEQLVDKSIAHIQQQQSAMDEPWSYMRNWLPKRYRSRVWMNGPETRQIRRFLHVPESDSGLGDLLQTLYTNEECPARWLCPGHAFEHSNLKCINDLIKLHGNQSDLLEANKAQHWRVDLEQGGVPKWTLRDPHVDVQRGTIAISLYTPFHAKIFASDLKNTKRTFDLSIRLAWGPTRKEIQTVLSQLVECNIRFLEIDASNLDALHHNPMEYTRDLFVEHLEKALWRPGLFVTLLGYPQESQNYIYFGIVGPIVFGFILNTSERPNIDWWDVQRHLYRFRRDISRAPHSFMDLTKRLEKLTPHLSPLMSLGLQSVDIFTGTTGFWGARFTVVNGTIGGAVAGTTPCEVMTLSEFTHPTLRRAVVQHFNLQSLNSLFMTVRHNPGLEQIDIPTREHDVYRIVEESATIWHEGGPNSLILTIYEQGLERVGRILAKVVIHKDPEMAIRIMEWNCSYVPRAMVNHPAVPKKVTQHGDNDAMISTAAPQDHSVTLEKATVHDDRDAKILSALARDRPGDLENFTLRISLLSDEGLACIPQVLRQAKIQHLTIECMAFDASREALLGQALGAVQWLMIKSLTLFGSNINTWMQLWAQHSDLNECVPWDHELLWLGVIGTELPKQELSHASVMWLHNAIYLLSPVETHIESIHMEGVDWRLVEGAADDPLSDRFVVIYSNNP